MDDGGSSGAFGMPAIIAWRRAISACASKSYMVSCVAIYPADPLAACYSPGITVGEVLRQMRSAWGCGGRPLAAPGGVAGDGANAERASQAAQGAGVATGGERGTGAGP